jgi:hypothetical protein
MIAIFWNSAKRTTPPSHTMCIKKKKKKKSGGNNWKKIKEGEWEGYSERGMREPEKGVWSSEEPIYLMLWSEAATRRQNL